MFELTTDLIAELTSIDTPTVCNALELLVPERRGYGFTTKPLVCIRPGLAPIVGIARTATIRAAHPSDPTADQAYARDGYYAYIDAGPKPSIVVIQDLDDERGYGSFWGEVNSNIHKGLGCDAVITTRSRRAIRLAARLTSPHTSCGITTAPCWSAWITSPSETRIPATVTGRE